MYMYVWISGVARMTLVPLHFITEYLVAFPIKGWSLGNRDWSKYLQNGVGTLRRSYLFWVRLWQSEFQFLIVIHLALHRVRQGLFSPMFKWQTECLWVILNSTAQTFPIFLLQREAPWKLTLFWRFDEIYNKIQNA